MLRNTHKVEVVPLLQCALEWCIALCRVTVKTALASHKVGYKHVPTLSNTVAPRCCVVEVKTLIVISIYRSCRFTTSTDSIFCVLHGVVERRKVCTYSNYCRCSKYCATLTKCLQCLILYGKNKVVHPQSKGCKQKIVCYLRMVCSNFKCSEECRESASQPHVFAQCHIYCTHHCRSIYRCPHLCNVSCPDNEEEVGR